MEPSLFFFLVIALPCDDEQRRAACQKGEIFRDDIRYLAVINPSRLTLLRQIALFVRARQRLEEVARGTRAWPIRLA